jgi:hypothetical protein
MPDETPKTDLLQTSNTDYKEFGPNLVREAEERRRILRTNTVVAGVERIMQSIEQQQTTIHTYRRDIAAAEGQIAKQQKRIAALQVGEFVLDSSDFSIVFNDPELNGGGL